jgi:glucose-6-phosphate isomerase
MSTLLNGKAWLGDFEDVVRARLSRYDAGEERVAARLWAQDASLWSGDMGTRQKIMNRLGWLSSPLTMLARRDELDCVTSAPYADVVLLGMGGSSLAPEVLQRVFGNAQGAPRLHVLDSTVAAAVQALQDRLDLSRALFVVSSKSGTTVETRSLADYFFERTGRTGDQFIAITDGGSLLARQARERGYASLFLNQQDIGGRYSALSFFGLVPAAIIGVDVKRLLERAAGELRASSAAVPAEQNRGLVLGVIMGELAAAGRDKLTFLASPSLEPFGDWAEQLIAESTGKEGRGVLPVVGERPGPPRSYEGDRLFVYLRLEGEGQLDERVEALREAGQPVVQFDLQDVYDLGAHFFLWEYATAVAGAVLGVNPFDEPNVTESKDNTTRFLEQYVSEGSLPAPEPGSVLSAGGITVSGSLAGASPAEALRSFVDEALERDYFAIMAYVPMDGPNESALRELQAAIRDRSRRATTLGFGPRFLHSTGQFHKGGPTSGRFLQIVMEDATQLAIPDAPYDFSTLAAAQALGDLEALAQRDYPLMRLHIQGDVAEAVSNLAVALGA